MGSPAADFTVIGASALQAPATITREKLVSLIQRAKYLQSQGAKEDSNAEFSQIMEFLKGLQTTPSKKPAVDADNTIRKDGAPPSLTEQQLYTAKQQIAAYRYLSRNMPLPPALRYSILQSSNSNNNNGDAAAAAGVVPIDGIETNDSESGTSGSSVAIVRSKSEESIATPYTIPKKQPRSSGASTSLPLDPYSVLAERDRRIKSRVQYRISELEKVPNNLATESGLLNGRHNQKLKAVIELKALRLLNKQKRLRQEIIHGLDQSTTLSTAVDRVLYRRMKKQSLREARMTEKIERQQRIERDQREKQKQLEYLQHICDHGRNLVATQLAWRARQQKLGRAVVQYHQYIEREEQKKADKISKERIRALKNDDEEAYMKLIDEAKDTRLTQLLRQTGAFLESLSRAVVDQQNDVVHRGEYQDVVPETQELEEGTKADYFSVTHRVKEEVSQPRLLSGGTLKEYQLKGLQWMVSLYNNHLNGILADEMGLGKTIQTISLITYLIEKKQQNGPYLIIVPLSTITNWTVEFEKWAPDVKVIVYKGPPLARRQLQMELRHTDFQVVLTTFEYIIKDRPVLSKIRWLHMIIDEGHRMKNTQSKLTSVLRQFYHSRYRLILTGTPLQNNLPELWALLNFILPKIFKSVKSFEEWFNTPFSNQGVQDKVALNEEEQLLIIKRLHKVLRPFLLRRLKKDVEAELPDKVERVVKCKLSALQVKLYSQMKKSGILYTASGEKGKTGIKGLNNTIMQLRKICNHPFVFEEVENAVNPGGVSNELLYRVSGKFELLDRMLPKLKATGHRVLIFFQMTQIMTIMEDFLHWRGFHYLRLDGSTKADERSSLLGKFNAPDSPYFVFLLSTRAGGLGLNLQAADTVIIFDSDWNPHQDLQAQDRAHRIGQTKEVRIFRLISANSIEENILARANYKLDIDGKVIQAGKFDNRSTDEDREAFLRSLLEDKNDNQEDAEDEEVDDEELNEMLKRSDEELAIFNKLDDERRREENSSRRGRGRGKKLERLLQEDELPEVYRNDEYLEEQAGPVFEYGRGQRNRENVRYDDGLTEEQWLNALENENVDLDELIAKKEARRRRRLERLQARLAGNTEDESSDTTNSRRGRKRRQDTSIGNGEVVLPRKRGRPRRADVNEQRKRQRSEEEEERLNSPETLAPRVRAEMTRIMDACVEALEDVREEDEDSYRNLADLFMDLVDDREYPQYYTMIQHPISINMVKRRIHSTYYKSLAEFRADFKLMFDNARTFNEEGSIVYEDANELERILEDKLRELCPSGEVAAASGEHKGADAPAITLKLQVGNGQPHQSAEGDPQSKVQDQQ